MVKFNFWTPLTDICGACSHDKYKHNRTVEFENADAKFEDVCGAWDSEYWRDNYNICGCGDFRPKWKFWVRSYLRVRPRSDA